MTTYTINLYSSGTLHNYCNNQYGDGERAIKRAKTYFEGAFDQHSQHSVNVNLEYSNVPAPVEDYDEPFYAEDPCGWGTVYYNYLFEWFRHYRVCNLSTPSADVHLLLTHGNNTSGGNIDWNHGHGVAITGAHIADLPSSYYTSGATSAYDGMGTALHEFGHYAMGNVDESHSRGQDYYHYPQGWFVTPMLDPTTKTAQDGENACNQTIYSTSEADGWEMWWDDCCTGEW